MILFLIVKWNRKFERNEFILLNPVRIYGTWDEGIVLDNHMLKSVFLGYDENGKEKFENTRTEIGELIYKFKYQKDKERVCLK